MNDKHLYTAVGLMSGTSLDGIDAALIQTDGEALVVPISFATLPFDPDLQASLREHLGAREDGSGGIARAEKELTLAQADAVREVLGGTGFSLAQVDIVGFHGQTLSHDPDNGFTWQIGDGALMAQELGVDVVNDFRTNDVRHGGQGAPFLPLYHRARMMSSNVERPVAILNIGGVANITWIGDGSPDDIVAFDTGPGNALIDDFVRARRGMRFDRDGKLAKQGSLNQDFLMEWLRHPYFGKKPPKSLDRNDFHPGALAALADEDGAATLTAFTVYAVEKAFSHLPAMPKSLYVTGGGRRNPEIMEGLRAVLRTPVAPVEDLGWNGDALEAEGFAYLAVRSLKGLSLSLPATTGVREPVSGGILHRGR
ncbi:MAG: anhydro-N-acetylmuramic acid kinase [Alphaproteobacteria bacterium]|nr:anhydro-N-acetylmuramic acid kinase [Alphaproteobacteria bacterium]